jgi:hypothetical protein
LALTSGLGDVKELAGETEARKEETLEGFTKRGGDRSARQIGKILTVFGGGFGGSVTKALFGKKTKTTISGTVQDKGWRVVKTWLQPEFDKIRYALGVRELLVAQFRYEKVSEVVSKPWASPKDISKVSLIVDSFIPPQFPPGQDYIQYYVRPELPDAEWVRINPLGHRTVFSEKGSIIPRIVNFNNERPVTARLEEAFVNTDGEVKQVRFRAVLNRPDNVEDTEIEADSYSPILKSYRMILTPRGGL